MAFVKFIVKHTLFIFNLIFTLLGLSIIAAGCFGLYYVRHNKIEEYLPKLNISDVKQALEYIDYFLIGVIVFGALIFLISFCGCCGSIAEAKGLLIPYAVIMFLVFSGSLALVITKDQLMHTIKAEVGKHGDAVFNATNPLEDKYINGIQFILKCCGKDGPEFYNNANIERLHITGSGFVSPSCCSTFDHKDYLAAKSEIKNKTHLKDLKCEKEDMYEKGCMTKVMEYIDEIGKYFKYSAITLAVVGIIAMLFAIYLYLQI